MQLIALHDADDSTYGNLALMKISTFHKAQGHEVVRYDSLWHAIYDKIYSSKVFTFTRCYDFLPVHTVQGGTGYGLTNTLPEDIEHLMPDYELYGLKHSMGFATRGCIRACPWCIVPNKEGLIHAHADVEEFTAHRDLVLMDCKSIC